MLLRKHFGADRRISPAAPGGLDQCRVASPAMAEARSFGRAHAVEQLTVLGVRSLRRSRLFRVAAKVLEHTLRLNPDT